jgi:hypothetical protein
MGYVGSEALPSERQRHHEIWWVMHFDPMNLNDSEARLRAAMTEQAHRLAPLIEGELATIEIKNPIQRPDHLNEILV